MGMSSSNSNSNGNGEKKSSDDYHRFETTITSWSYTDEANPSSPVLYTIVVREYYQLHNFIEWKICRRYSDFEELHDKVTLHLIRIPLVGCYH
jgi:hypothetical protein